MSCLISKFKQRGMTLVEVLISGIILFISISVISMVARTKTLNEERLVKAIEHAYIAEYSIATIKYHLEYTKKKYGKLLVNGIEYNWHAFVENTSPPLRGLNNAEGGSSKQSGLLTLYKVTITLAGKEKPIYEFSEYFWKNQ